MSFMEFAESALRGVAPLAGDLVKKVPVAGEVISGLQGCYHLGSAGYDAATGDRDGAVNHGVQGAVNLLAMLPGANHVFQALDKSIGPAGAVARAQGAANGVDAMKEAPQSAAELAGQEAVFATNAIFGKDDTNWNPFLSGNTPEGTRRGEIGAGLSMLLPIFGPELAVANELGGNPIGNFAGDLLGVQNGAPTSGAQPSAAARLGQNVFGAVNGLFGGLFD